MSENFLTNRSLGNALTNLVTRTGGTVAVQSLEFSVAAYLHRCGTGHHSHSSVSSVLVELAVRTETLQLK